MLNDWAVPSMSSFGVKCAGHEGAGVIVKVGEEVTGFKVGQRAGFKPIQDVCHQCEYCRTGKDNYCLKGVLTGLHCDGMSLAEPSIEEVRGTENVYYPGSYKQYVVCPENYTTVGSSS